MSNGKHARGPHGPARRRPSWRAGLAIAIALALWAIAATPAAAQQTETPGAGAVSVEELRELVSTIEDPGRRDALVGQLKALIAARDAPRADGLVRPDGFVPGLLSRLSRQVESIGADMVSAAEFAIDLPRFQAWVTAQVTDPEARLRWLSVALAIAVRSDGVSTSGLLPGTGTRTERRGSAASSAPRPRSPRSSGMRARPSASTSAGLAPPPAA